MYYQTQNTNKGQEATKNPTCGGKIKKYDSMYMYICLWEEVADCYP